MQLERDLQQVLDEKEELETARDAYRCVCVYVCLIMFVRLIVWVCV